MHQYQSFHTLILILNPLFLLILPTNILSVCAKMLVYTLLLINQMRRLINELHQLRQIMCPIVKHIARVFALLEVHYSWGTICLCLYAFTDNHLGQELFSLRRAQIEQFGHTTNFNPSVILGHHSDVVFDYSTSEILPSLLW